MDELTALQLLRQMLKEVVRDNAGCAKLLSGIWSRWNILVTVNCEEQLWPATYVRFDVGTYPFGGHLGASCCQNWCFQLRLSGVNFEAQLWLATYLRFDAGTYAFGGHLGASCCRFFLLKPEIRKIQKGLLNNSSQFIPIHPNSSQFIPTHPSQFIPMISNYIYDKNILNFFGILQDVPRLTSQAFWMFFLHLLPKWHFIIIMSKHLLPNWIYLIIMKTKPRICWQSVSTATAVRQQQGY